MPPVDGRAGREPGARLRFREDYRFYWSYILHFVHVPFYVYAYAFGDCLVSSLYAVYEEAPEGFEPRYLDLLRAGGTLRHKELLAPFGLDASDPGFWAKAAVAREPDRPARGRHAGAPMSSKPPSSAARVDSENSFGSACAATPRSAGPSACRRRGSPARGCWAGGSTARTPPS